MGWECNVNNGEVSQNVGYYYLLLGTIEGQSRFI